VTESFNPTEWITTKEAAELTGYTMARFRQLAKAETVEAQKRGASGEILPTQPMPWRSWKRKAGFID